MYCRLSVHVDMRINMCNYVRYVVSVCIDATQWMMYMYLPTALLQRHADASIRNTEGKTALDLAEPLAAQVLSGEYKKSELLQAAR